MQVSVTILGGPGDGQEMTFFSLPITLGREGDPQLRIVDCWASRHHCQFFTSDGRLMIRDLASKHGTYVNGQRIDECELAVGDKVMVGLTVVSISAIQTAPVSLRSSEGPIDRESGVSV